MACNSYHANDVRKQAQQPPSTIFLKGPATYLTKTLSIHHLERLSGFLMPADIYCLRNSQMNFRLPTLPVCKQRSRGHSPNT